MTTIKPDDIICDYIDDIVITGFRQGDDYFIIQRDDLSTNEFHIELNDQGQGCYNGLQEITIHDDKIIFQLNLIGQVSLKTDTIVISDVAQRTEYKKIAKELELIRESLKR
jgi:hypothetical protein